MAQPMIMGPVYRSTRPIRVSIAALGASLFFSPLSALQIFAHVAWSDFLLALAVLAVVAESNTSLRFTRVQLPYFLVLLALMGAHAVSSMTQGSFEYNTAFAVSAIALAIIPFCFGFFTPLSQRELKTLITLWTAGGACGCIYLVLQVQGLLPDGSVSYWQQEQWRIHGRATGLTQYPGLAGRSAFLTLPGLFLAFSYARRWSHRVAVAGLILITLQALDYSGSRAALVGALVFTASYLLLTLLWRRRVAMPVSRSTAVGYLVLACVLGALGAVAITLGKAPLVGRLVERFLDPDISASASSRLRSALNDQALLDFLSSPIWGRGFAWSPFSQSAVAHNIYLQYLQVGGILGGAGLLCFLLYPMVRLRDAVRTSSSDHVPYVVIALLAATIATSVWIAGQSGFNDYGSIAPFCLALVGAETLKRRHQRPTEHM